MNPLIPLLAALAVAACQPGPAETHERRPIS